MPYGSVDPRYHNADYSSAIKKVKDMGREEVRLESFGKAPKEYRGINRRIYFDEAYMSRFTPAETQALFLVDNLDTLRQGRRVWVDMQVNISESTDILIDSFKAFIKDKRKEQLHNIKRDGRFNTPDFDKLELYLAAHLLKVKQVKASFLNTKARAVEILDARIGEKVLSA